MTKEIRNFIAILERDMDFENVTYQSEDNHAWYFDAVDSDINKVAEIKVEKDEGRWASFRLEGHEDWSYVDSLENY